MNAADPLQPRPSGRSRAGRQRFGISQSDNPGRRRNATTVHSAHGALIAVLVASVAVGGLIAYTRTDSPKSLSAAGSPSVANAGAAVPNASVGTDAAPTTTADPAAVDTTPALSGGAVDTSKDLVEPTGGAAAGCLLSEQSIRAGTIGDSVKCLQTALTGAGFYNGAISGTFDAPTDLAVKAMQTARNLFVDGVVGRESAISLGIWPNEASLVVHTPKPAPGAKDSLGFPLSSVSVIGADIPPLPANSGSGKRLVYDRAQQRVWAIDKNEFVIRSWLVSGSQYNNEVPGTDKVYSKSVTSTAWNGKALLPHMVRYQKTKLGNIGFHGIPIHIADGTPYETEDQLGTRLSGGCTRQSNPDGDFVWAFADIGTTVVVI